MISRIDSILNNNIQAITQLKTHLPADLATATTLLVNLTGKLIISGMGKSGHIGKKIAASFSSTGTSAFFVHPGEASHGDLGMITRNDALMLISNSGQTAELHDIIAHAKNLDIPIIGIYTNTESYLAKMSDLKLNLPQIEEASNINAPTTSAMLALVLADLLMILTQEAKSFSILDYKKLHPAGKLGGKL